VAALFDEREALASLRGRRNDIRSARRDKRSEISSQDESKSIERRCLVLVRTLDFALARLINMIMVCVGVIMGVQMGVDDQRVNAVAMDVLKRRQDIGGYKRDTAVERDNPPHQQQCSSSRAPARKTIRQALICSDSRQLSFVSIIFSVQEHTVTRTRSPERIQLVNHSVFGGPAMARRQHSKSLRKLGDHPVTDRSVTRLYHNLPLVARTVCLFADISSGSLSSQTGHSQKGHGTEDQVVL
jgi:hypothetical protein